MKYDDIIKTEIKKIHGDKWRFMFRENGYVILEKFRQGEKLEWYTHLHGVSLDACVQYVYQAYNGHCGVLIYDELEDADV